VVEHLTQKQVEDYCRSRLPAAELLTVTDHFDSCEVCRERVERGGTGDAAFFELRSQVFEDVPETVQHLTMEQAAAFVDHSLSGEERQVVSDHLTHCEQCVRDVDDLREFRNELAPSLDREYQPDAVASAVPSPASSPDSSWRRLLHSLAAPFRVSPVPAFGGAALGIILLAAIAWFVWRTPPPQEPQIANAPTPASSPTSQTTSQPDTPQPNAPQPAPIVAQVNDGSGTVALDQQGKLSGADDLPPAYQTLVKKALSTGRIERSAQLNGLTRPPSSLMGTNDTRKDFSVLEPLGNVLLNNRLTFRWSAMEGATGYVVEVYDEKFTPITTSPQLTNLSWTTTLPRGHIYTWQVKAIKSGEEITSPRPPAPQAKLRILDQAKANELANARRAYASSHLTLGLLYADAGLLRQAEQEFRLLQKSNPNSDLARNLLRQIQSLRRLQ
jgi:anti-sigma factor RsiW